MQVFFVIRELLESFVSYQLRELIQQLENLAPDPECLTNFRTGAKSGRLLSSLRFIQQVPRNLTFTNRSREFYLFYSHSAIS